MTDNFRIHSFDEWGGAIRSLEIARDSMEDAGEKLKQVVLESLTRCGITGDVANTIVKAYEDDVLVVIKRFISEVNAFIDKNKKVHAGGEDLNDGINGRVHKMNDFSKIASTVDIKGGGRIV